MKWCVAGSILDGSKVWYTIYIVDQGSNK
jgi:hypothetical protein